VSSVDSAVGSADCQECRSPIRFCLHRGHRGRSCLRRWISLASTRPMSRLLLLRQRQTGSRDGTCLFPNDLGGADVAGVVW
jgi:hypothetical protein